MKTLTTGLLTLMLIGSSFGAAAQDAAEVVTTSARQPARKVPYVPTAENLAAREKFADAGFGIFIHWGIYSMFAQGEWYLQNCGMSAKEYAKAADGFYPAKFNAAEWVSAIKDAGARYITITSRHHDGFSMFATKQSPYNIVDATPFGRDVLKELADECEKQGITLNFYYSHIDWTREDYPAGRTGLKTGKNPAKADWPHYYKFMNNQLTELLTNYGKVGAIWFDGLWDHDMDSVPFDWQLEEQYDLIHRLQPSTLVANNHHCDIIEGEDIQLFERDLPGENTAGYSEQTISELPLETCQTMNRKWGYVAADNEARIPLAEMGKWMRQYGETIHDTRRGDFKPQPWGAATRKGNRLFVHIMTADSPEIYVPTNRKVKSAKVFGTDTAVKYRKEKKRPGVTLTLAEVPSETDYIVELITD